MKSQFPGSRLAQAHLRRPLHRRGVWAAALAVVGGGLAVAAFAAGTPEARLPVAPVVSQAEFPATSQVLLPPAGTAAPARPQQVSGQLTMTADLPAGTHDIVYTLDGQPTAPVIDTIQLSDGRHILASNGIAPTGQRLSQGTVVTVKNHLSRQEAWLAAAGHYRLSIIIGSAGTAGLLGLIILSRVLARRLKAKHGLDVSVYPGLAPKAPPPEQNIMATTQLYYPAPPIADPDPTPDPMAVVVPDVTPLTAPGLSEPSGGTEIVFDRHV